MGRWFFGGVVVLATIACQENVRFIQAPPLEGLNSGVFVRLVEDGDVGAILTPTEPLLINQPVEGGDRLVFAAYERSVDTFAWPPGVLPVLDTFEDAAFLPSPDVQWILEPGEDTWQMLVDDVLASVPLARPTPERCLLSGGCYQAIGESERGECTVCEPEPPAPTVMPEPVQWDTWSSCPVGASLVADADLALQACDIPDLVACGQYERQPMLSAVCQPVATCPGGPFAERRMGDASRLFVDPTASTGGDGSENNPFDNLTEAAANAAPDTVIYLAEGAYDVPSFTTRLNLRGVCPERVALNGFVVRSATVAAERVSVAGGIDVGAGAHLEVAESWIDGFVVIDAATAYLNASVLLSSVELRGAAYVRFEQSSLRGFVGSTPDSVIVGTDLSIEASINTAGAVDLRRSRVDRASFSTMSGGPVVLEDIWWQDSQDCTGATLLVKQATASLTRVSVNRPGAGALVFDGADATLDEVLVRDSVGCSRALTSSASDVVVSRFAAARISRESVYLNGDSNVFMQDILLSKGNIDSEPEETIRIQEPAMLTVERARIVDHQHHAVFALGEAALGEFYDVDISDLRSIPGLDSRVFEARRATITGARIRVTDATQVLLASDSATFRIEDLSTERVVNPVRARDRSDVEVTRAQFDETFGVGACSQFGATAHIFDVVVNGVRTEGGEDPPNCPNGVVAGGAAFTASVDGALFVTRFTVTDAVAAFLSFKPGTILAQEGWVQQTPIAVSGDQDTNLSEFMIRVRYEDVEQPILLR